LLEVYSELNSFPFLQEDYRQKLEQKRLAREIENKLKTLEAEKAEAVAAKIAAEEAAKAASKTRDNKKDEEEAKNLEEQAARNKQILDDAAKEAKLRVDLFNLKKANKQLEREKLRLEQESRDEKEKLEADKARLEAQLKEKEQLEADKARLEAQLKEKERELKESEARRVASAEASADTIGIEDDVDSDVGLASTDELMAGAAAASLPPPTNPTSAEGSSTRPTTPEPPSTTTSESDPTVGEKLAELAVMVATSEATMAAVDKTASTGSTSALDSSISELGMDAFPDIPEEGEEDYDFRFSQLSDFSQKM
jgi:myosin heavy subunit